jgi:hypothetical protein
MNRKNNSIHITSKKKKTQKTTHTHQGINLTKEIKDFYNENYKMLEKLKKAPRYSPCS